MTPPKIHPNEDKTRMLQIRINPDGRWYKLHPKDLDIEHYVETRGGRATVRLLFLLSRNKVSLSGVSNREFHKVKD